MLLQILLQQQMQVQIKQSPYQQTQYRYPEVERIRTEVFHHIRGQKFPARQLLVLSVHLLQLQLFQD
jgi:hypothetical protein